MASLSISTLGNGQVVDSESNRYGSFLLSYLGRLNYSYDNRYYLGLSLRDDISSKLGKNNRSGVFYSVSGAWRFGRESFLKDNELLTDAKLRASYGTNGNLPDGEYTWRGLYNFGDSYASEPAISLSQLANLNLGWEKSRSLNVGLDLTFAKRFALSVEYFNKYTTDLLMSVPISSNHAVTKYQANRGEISNRGIEVELHASDILHSRKFRWDADFSLTKIRSRVEALPNGDIISGAGNYLYRPGYDIYTFYIRQFHDVEKETGLARFVIDPSKPATADNLTYKSSDAQFAPTKSAYPKVYGGLTNTFSYGGFTLSTLLTYQFGGYFLDNFEGFAISDGYRTISVNSSKDLVGNYWTPTNKSAAHPLPILNNPLISARLASTRFLHSSDYVRLKELSLSYRLPNHVTKALHLNTASLSLTANNLFYLYAATPNRELEVPLNGYRTSDIPALRTVSFGVNVGF